jgi:hypothetical protein
MESVEFCVQNALKLTHEHVRFQNISGVKPPDPLKYGRGIGGDGQDEVREGRRMDYG